MNGNSSSKLDLNLRAVEETPQTAVHIVHHARRTSHSMVNGHPTPRGWPCNDVAAHYITSNNGIVPLVSFSETIVSQQWMRGPHSRLARISHSNFDNGPWRGTSPLHKPSRWSRLCFLASMMRRCCKRHCLRFLHTTNSTILDMQLQLLVSRHRSGLFQYQPCLHPRFRQYLEHIHHLPLWCQTCFQQTVCRYFPTSLTSRAT